MFKRLKKWWMFTILNPVIRTGEAGGFKWKFRRLTFSAETLSGNFKAEWTASEHPCACLMGAEDDSIHGFLYTIYLMGMTLTRDEQFVEDIHGAINRYAERLEKTPLEEDGEEAAIAEVKAIQEHAELPKSEQKRIDREFNKAMRRYGKRS